MRKSQVITVFENFGKSLIQRLRFHFLVNKSSLKIPKIAHFVRAFKNTKAGCQTVLPEMSILIGKKLV